MGLNHGVIQRNPKNCKPLNHGMLYRNQTKFDGIESRNDIEKPEKLYNIES